MATEDAAPSRAGKLLLLVVAVCVQLLLVGIALGMTGGLTLS